MANSEPPQRPSIEKKEIFRYDLTWMGIKAGSATLKFSETDTGVKISSKAESADWVSLFYRVEDRAVSLVKIVDNENGTCLKADRYRIRIREGRHRRDKEILFYPEKNEALYINHLENERKTFKVPGDVLDPLSGFYQIRRMDIGSEPLFVKIFDSKKVWNVKVDVIGRETVETEAGSFKTVIVKPELRSEGIFNKKGEIFIYLTDDDRHIPVLLKTKVLIGYVEAELVGGRF
ncbi:MAG: DUF3108 domain-containing protein [Nitrospirae bacterium]|nr:DUF3108 domain-containing protein [Nitrospirota bacterium]